MAGDRFKSPVVTAMARRQLFDSSNHVTHVVSPIKAGQSILASPQKPVVASPTSKYISNFIAIKAFHPLRGYILGVLMHTTAWDRLRGGDETLK